MTPRGSRAPGKLSVGLTGIPTSFSRVVPFPEDVVEQFAVCLPDESRESFLEPGAEAGAVFRTWFAQTSGSWCSIVTSNLGTTNYFRASHNT